LSYLFEEYKHHLHTGDVVTWTSMIQAYNMNGKFQEALQLFEEMTQVDIVPSEYTYSIVFKVVAEMTNLHKGQRIHKQLKVYLTKNKINFINN
jgi:pentatricopeptide repeat protein